MQLTSTKLAQNSCKLQTDLQTKIKNLEQNITDKDEFNGHKTRKDELENPFGNITTGFKIRSKCDWYQYGEKSTKYFLNLEQKAIDGTVE